MNSAYYETEPIERVLADEGYDVLESATLAQKIAQALRSTDPQCVVDELVSAAEAVVCEWDDINSPDVDCTGVGGLPPEPDSPAMGRLRKALSSLSLRSESEVKAEGAREALEKAARIAEGIANTYSSSSARQADIWRRAASFIRSQSSEVEV